MAFGANFPILTKGSRLAERRGIGAVRYSTTCTAGRERAQWRRMPHGKPALTLCSRCLSGHHPGEELRKTWVGRTLSLLLAAPKVRAGWSKLYVDGSNSPLEVLPDYTSPREGELAEPWGHPTSGRRLTSNRVSGAQIEQPQCCHFVLRAKESVVDHPCTFIEPLNEATICLMEVMEESTRV